MLGLSWAATKVLHRAKNGPNPKVVSEADPASRIDCSTTYPVYSAYLLIRAEKCPSTIRADPINPHALEPPPPPLLIYLWQEPSRISFPSPNPFGDPLKVRW